MLSLRAKNLKPSPTLALMAKAKELMAQGRDVISLAVGEPDWDTASFIKESGIKAIQENFTKYTPVAGIPALKQAIVEQTKAQIGYEYQPQQVCVCSGAKFVIFGALQMLCNPGDEVIVPAPYWVSYPVMAELAGALPKVVVGDKSSSFKLTSTLLEKAITPQTKILLLNSPSNPTGEIYTAEELKSLAEVLKKHPQIWILSDDIYNQLVTGSSSVAPHILAVAPELASRTLIINGVSKSYSMTGWRIGWGLGPKMLIDALTDYQSQAMGSVCSISQKAALTALQKGDQEVKDKVRELASRKQFAVDLLNKIPGIKSNHPYGAFYLWIHIESLFGHSYKGERITSSSQFCDHLLNSFNVALMPGNEFGLEGFIRMSYALNAEKMKEAILRLGQFVSALSK